MNILRKIWPRAKSAEVSSDDCVVLVDDYEQSRKWRDVYSEMEYAIMYPETREKRERYIVVLQHSAEKNPNSLTCFDWVGADLSCLGRCDYYSYCVKRQLFEEVDCVVIVEET